jgi:hypothetical protein
MAHTDPHGATAPVAAGHETTDANLGGVERLIVGLSIFLALVFVLMWFLYAQFRSREASRDVPPSPVTARQGDRLPPAPRLQTAPYDDLRTFRQAEQVELETFKWIDRQAGIAQIPIERAIEILGERGLPAPPSQPPGTGQAAPAGAAPAAGAAPGSPGGGTPAARTGPGGAPR